MLDGDMMARCGEASHPIPRRRPPPALASTAGGGEGMVRASRRSQVPPFEVMAILDRVEALRAAGREVLSLCAGEPSGGPPIDVRVRARALHTDDDILGYTGALGTAELRRAIAEHHRRGDRVRGDPGAGAGTPPAA